jgi:hypothetical protein
MGQVFNLVKAENGPGQLPDLWWILYRGWEALCQSGLASKKSSMASLVKSAGC